jgi:hypothetical protein
MHADADWQVADTLSISFSASPNSSRLAFFFMPMASPMAAGR